jgi:uncharacterized protein (TIGR00369 family)
MMKTRSYTYDPRRVSSQELVSRTGLESLQAMLDGELPAPSIAQTLNFTLIQIEAGLAVFAGQTEDFLNNPIGTIHGGYAAAILDSALGCAVQSMLPIGFASTTVDLGIKYVRAMTSETGALRAEGRIVHFGRSIATAEAKLVGRDNNKLYAHGSATFQIFKIGGNHD